MKSKSYLIPIILIFTITILISCCQQKADWQGTIEEVDGVTVIKNPKEPMYGGDVFSLEGELSIGEAKGKEEYMFYRIRDIAIDEKERIYVLDDKKVHIKVYDKNGDYLRTIGRQGQGPGEFEFPMGINILSQNIIVVHQGRSLVYFNLDGEFIKKEQLTKTSRPQWYEIDSDGNIIGNFADQMKMVLMKYDSDQELLFTVAEVEPFGEAMDRLFSPVALCFNITKDNDIVWGKTTDYELNITNPSGVLLRKIITDYDPIEITEEDKRQMSEKILSKRKIELPKYFQPLEGLGISSDEEGRIYAIRRDGARSTFFDVFDSDGRYIAKVHLKLQLPPIWKKNKLYVVEEDENGYQFVKRYKVTWKI